MCGLFVCVLLLSILYGSVFVLVFVFCVFLALLFVFVFVSSRVCLFLIGVVGLFCSVVYVGDVFVWCCFAFFVCVFGMGLFVVVCHVLQCVMRRCLSWIVACCFFVWVRICVCCLDCVVVCFFVRS